MIDERLLIEATPELLEGWCGPVVGHDGDTDACDDGLLVRMDVPALDGFGSWYLDLARAECRDRVARMVFGSPTPALMQEMRKGHALLQRSGGMGFFARVEAAEDYGGTHVPALAGLDLHDDTRLPDGSRLVDALALAAVWREVSRG